MGSYARLTTNILSTAFIPNSGGNLKLPLTLDTPATTTTELLRRAGDIMGKVHDFRYMVRGGDNDPTGIEVPADSLIRIQIRSNARAVIHDIAYNHVCEGGPDSWNISNDPSGTYGSFEECEGGQDRHGALAAQIDHKVDGTRPVL